MLLRQVDWPAQDLSAVCLSQAVTAGAQFIINGTNSNVSAGIQAYPSGLVPGIYRSISGNTFYQDQNTFAGYTATFGGTSRTVAIDTSGADFSAYNFTISGTYCGQLVTVMIAGGNSAIVETTQLFSTVTSVTCDTNVLLVDDITVGTGLTGHVGFFLLDYLQSISSFTVQVNVPTDVTNNINFSFACSLYDMPTIPVPDGVSDIFGGTNNYMMDPTAGSLTNLSASIFQSLNVLVFRWCTVLITPGSPPPAEVMIAAVATDATGHLTVLFLDDGI